MAVVVSLEKTHKEREALYEESAKGKDELIESYRGLEVSLDNSIQIYKDVHTIDNMTIDNLDAALFNNGVHNQ